ncbi:MAG: efflux RND transporter permease subunit, partial [Chloroflexi bacterium]|nr:efflux RND transporter permease subunit [Chloroflexota bacterium]
MDQKRNSSSVDAEDRLTLLPFDRVGLPEGRATHSPNCRQNGFRIDDESGQGAQRIVRELKSILSEVIGQSDLGMTVEGLERYPINLRYGRELRDNLPALRRVLVPTPGGAQIPMGQLANLVIRRGPPSIKSENARLNAWIYVDIKGIDVGTYVERAQQAVRENITLPAGYSLVWSGQYEYMQRAKERLRVVVPITLGIILLLLYLNFGNIIPSLI